MFSRRCGLTLMDGDRSSLYADTGPHEGRFLRSKDRAFSQVSIAEFVNMSVHFYLAQNLVSARHYRLFRQRAFAKLTYVHIARNEVDITVIENTFSAPSLKT